MPRNDHDAEDMATLLSDVISNGRKKDRSVNHQIYGPIVKKVAVIVLIIAMLGGGVFGAIKLWPHKSNPLSANLRSYGDTGSFTAYLPENLPGGYTTDAASTSYSGGVIFSTLHNQDDTKPDITLSQQPIPKGIAIQSILGLVPPQPVSIPSGTFYLTSTDTSSNATLVTSSSWILMNAPKSLNSDLLEQIAGQLKPLN